MQLGYSKCAKIMILKQLWGRFKTTNGMDALDDLPDCPEDGDDDADFDGNSDIDGDGTLVALQPGETSVPKNRATFGVIIMDVSLFDRIRQEYILDLFYKKKIRIDLAGLIGPMN